MRGAYGSGCLLNPSIPIRGGRLALDPVIDDPDTRYSFTANFYFSRAWIWELLLYILQKHLRSITIPLIDLRASSIGLRCWGRTKAIMCLQKVKRRTEMAMKNLPEKLRSYLLGSLTDYWYLCCYLWEKYLRWTAFNILEGYAMAIISTSRRIMVIWLLTSLLSANPCLSWCRHRHAIHLRARCLRLMYLGYLLLST